ncbi:MAG: family 20 glycosylhydrolase, partial [Faecalibacillus sp.]
MQNILKKLTAFILSLAMVVTLLPSTMTNVNAETNDSFLKIFHLDAGRKYFSVDQIEKIIDTMALNGYNNLELAIGNDGLRFLLDDMSVTANDTTYTSDAVKAGIQAGNKVYYNAGTYNELTQTEMDTIITYASKKGISIIPLINTPGHMDAILDCMESVGISNPAYSNSARTVDVTNTAAVNFTMALLNKYIQYFRGKGCTYFNMGCDEYANDVSNSGFAGLISSDKYGDFITYVNNMAAQVKAAGMTPMAFNDGIYYNSNTSSGTFDTDIVIAYWTTGWTGYSPASAEFLAGKGHTIINTNDAWYYVLGRQAGNSSGYTIATAQNGVKNTSCTDVPGDNDPTAAGCMICLWCDTPSASYSDTEVSNVTGLISSFAANNPTYFTVYEEVIVTVNDIETVTINGANHAGTYTTKDPSVATVEVTGTDGTEATPKYTKASVTCNTLISSNQNNWTAVSGYYYTPDDTNYYPVYAKRSSSRGNYTYTWGYKKTDSTDDIIQIGNTQSTYFPNYTAPDITVYTKSDTEGTPASTTITFTGHTVGTTYVTIGDTNYMINVVAEDLSKVTPLTAEYWITNLQVTADGSTSKSISAKSAYGEDGVDISTLVPESGTYAYGSVVYWKGTVLDSSNKQTTASGAENDKTGSGKDFNLIRYYNGSWQYFYEADRTWNTISSTDQVVIYWLQPTEVTKEITTLVKDWGYSPSNQQGDNNNKVALTVAVVYPDGTVSPAEGDMYSTSTTLFNYWENRDIGLVAPVNNSDYEISKITVTDGTRDQSETGQWGANDTITWDKVTNEAGEQWYNETTYWDETVGGTPMVNGVTSNITWSNYNTAKLVLIYLKPIHYDTNLIVNWVDDNASGALISTMEVAVSSDGTPTTFYNGLKQTSALPTEGVGGTFTLDDDAYVTNSSNVNQTFNKNISTVPGVADQYKSGLYQYVSAELSADGKTLTLHYNINENKLSKNYVVDFGLPVKVPLSELVENTDNISEVNVISSNAQYDSSNKQIIYTPGKILTSTDVVIVKVSYGDDTNTFRIGFIPATTVYYEESKAKYENTKTEGSNSDIYQTLSTVGSNNYYGFDQSYSNDLRDSNGTVETFNNANSKGEFVFKGTGVDVYARITPETGSIAVKLYEGSGSNLTIKKTYVVDTKMLKGSTDKTEIQDKQTGYNT